MLPGPDGDGDEKGLTVDRGAPMLRAP